ncbi:hypothetical protein H0W26_05830, partial [Candidatus Dependentiae bacterium]|nr:hypothetical protein [Candidatus Dependentiae bacterium]
MEHVPRAQFNNAEVVNNLLNSSGLPSGAFSMLSGLMQGTGLNVLGGSSKQAQSVKPSLFPLKDEFFKNIVFRDIAQQAQAGELAYIREFITRYPENKEYKDEKGQNLLSHAIAGYCKGVIKAWEVFTYLLEKELSQSPELKIYLETTDNEALDRIQRKQDIQTVLHEYATFIATDEQPFYEYSSPPSSRASSSQNCCIS